MEKKKLVVLVIEDESLLLQAIAKKLTLAGAKSVTCTTAEQALDYLNNISKYPNVIWLDYHLNGMNGLEFITEVKKHKSWKTIPIVVVSNSASDEKVHTLLALGAKKYLLKAQYRLEDIVKTVLSYAGK